MTARSEDVVRIQAGLPQRVANHLRRNTPLVILDVAVVVAAYVIPLVVRFEGSVPDRYWGSFWAFLPMVVGAHIAANYMFGLYGQMWRYASVQEARRLLLAGTVAGLLVLAAVEWMGPIRPLPISVVILGVALAFLGFGGIRFQSRLFGLRRRGATGSPARVLIVGAGDAGAMVLADIHRNGSTQLDPVGLVDDDPRKLGVSLHGVRVLARRGAIPDLVERLSVDQVLLAIPSAPSELVADVASLCEVAGVPLRVLPSVHEIVNGRVTVRDIRDLRIEDLLGRGQVETDLESVRAVLHGRRVLITGAGGSIGSEIARQVQTFEPAELLLLDHDETHLHDLVTDLESSDGVVPLLADVRDRDRMLDLFQEHKPEMVFHAAAHKHVPVLEAHPEEAVRTNVTGTANVADAAVAAGTKRFVLISTDKAIRPESVMGASKWFAEQIVRGVSGRGGDFCAVRFGNVLGSRGSVIPTFLRQIARGGPVTVTDPNMTRYFMSVREAVQLVLQAAALAEGGEVFTLDMGESVNILDLARKVIRLSGGVPDQDVKIEVVGARPGEKLVEDLVGDGEHHEPSAHPSILIARPRVPDPAALRAAIRELSSMSSRATAPEVAANIKALAAGGMRSIDLEVAG